MVCISGEPLQRASALGAACSARHAHSGAEHAAAAAACVRSLQVAVGSNGLSSAGCDTLSLSRVLPRRVSKFDVNCQQASFRVRALVNGCGRSSLQRAITRLSHLLRACVRSHCSRASADWRAVIRLSKPADASPLTPRYAYTCCGATVGSVVPSRRQFLRAPSPA